MNTAELLVKCLENEGVKVVFGIPGEENLAVMNALAHSGIRFITVRHEQGAAFMADVYGRLTGHAGVCLATLGPGATNLITGVADGARAITDVLALRGGELTNLVLSAITGVSGEVSRFCSVYPMDINGDGVTEVPRTVSLQGEDAVPSVSQRVDWINFDASGTASRVLSTYHDVADGWYFQLPDGWPERVWVSRSALPDEVGITFYTGSNQEETYVPVLRITALSGSERERLAVRTGRFILGRNDGVIYVGELLKGNQAWKYSVTEDEVRASFSLIGTEWSAGDN